MSNEDNFWNYVRKAFIEDDFRRPDFRNDNEKFLSSDELDRFAAASSASVLITGELSSSMGDGEDSSASTSSQKVHEDALEGCGELSKCMFHVTKRGRHGVELRMILPELNRSTYVYVVLFLIILYGEEGKKGVVVLGQEGWYRAIWNEYKNSPNN